MDKDEALATAALGFLSIKPRNLFYWTENMEAEEREENKENPLFMPIWSYLAGESTSCEKWGTSIPSLSVKYKERIRKSHAAKSRPSCT